MTSARESIDVDDDTHIGPLLERAADGPVFLRRRDSVYRLEPAPNDENIWAGYDPEVVRRALLDVAGSWSDVDPDELKAHLYRGRDEGTRPPDRP
jgi:hypothetical protein